MSERASALGNLSTSSSAPNMEGSSNMPRYQPAVSERFLPLSVMTKLLSFTTAATIITYASTKRTDYLKSLGATNLIDREVPLRDAGYACLVPGGQMIIAIPEPVKRVEDSEGRHVIGVKASAPYYAGFMDPKSIEILPNGLASFVDGLKRSQNDGGRVQLTKVDISCTKPMVDLSRRIHFSRVEDAVFTKPPGPRTNHSKASAGAKISSYAGETAYLVCTVDGSGDPGEVGSDLFRELIATATGGAQFDVEGTVVRKADTAFAPTDPRLDAISKSWIRMELPSSGALIRVPAGAKLRFSFDKQNMSVVGVAFIKVDWCILESL
ncbi:hypothetical protein BT96DRAFT_977311 [Gymnopus androsaceus JB14]|uniref:Uncharacterized protein n=1 Tax=Gymnopus androsaceus JB14 TaxID=1447944 RepID=A0A6A4HGN8_9AGAR|nr:hypothetical protein BT96DRAFT_977311 [Gymnopus androsaceus JB14]